MGLSPSSSHASGGSQSVLVATKHLTTADILTWHTVSVIAVPAVVGKIIIPLRGWVELNAGSIPFDNLDNGGLDYNAAGTELAAGFLNSNYGIDFLGDPMISATNVGWSTKDHGADIFPLDPALLIGQALTITAEHLNPSQGNGDADLFTWYVLR